MSSDFRPRVLRQVVAKGLREGVRAAELDVAASGVAQGVRTLSPVPIAVALAQQGVGELLLCCGVGFVIRGSTLSGGECYGRRVVHSWVGNRRHARRGGVSQWDRGAKAGRAWRRWSGGRGESTAGGHAVSRP